MTTVAQSQFSTMEVPPGDDSMEMASPYQGHMDDFEIDLDVMEDQISEVDQDLDVVDATPEPANRPESIQDDADMVDEIDERAMIDADENNQQTVNHTETDYYRTEETYETQMVEEDYEEDIDAPVPEQQPDIVVTDTQLDQQTVQETSEFPDNQEPTEQGQGQEEEEHHDDEVHLPEEDVAQHDLQQQQPKEVEDHDTEEAAEESESVEHHIDQQHNRQENDTNNSALVELHETDLNGIHDERQAQDEELEITHIHETGVYPDQEADQVEEKSAHDTVDQETEGPREVSHLHPVKVLYQDSEISLFPPREGDSSETFFLEDESLAHEDLGKLLASCREILGEHVSEEEVLTVDIDALNLQLNEDSYHISKVTLSQIVGLYLDLCRNDSINEPEPLYLTLSTKPTLPAEISNLLAAAGEGKGLSHIHQWDEYEDEQEIGDSSVDEEREAQEQEEPQPSEQATLVEVSEQQHTEEEHVERQLAPEEADTKDHAASGVHEGDETETKSADTTTVAYDGQEESALVVTDGQDEQQQESTYEQGGPSGEPNEEEPETADAGPEDEQYDYEEEASQSTATLAQASADELKVDTVTEESVKQFPTGSADASEKEKISTVEDLIGEDEEVYDEHQDYENHVDEHGEYESRQYESLGVPQDGHKEQSTADQDQSAEPEKADTVPDQTLEIPGADYEESGGQTAPQPQDEAHKLNEDLLGIDEDIFRSPAKKSKLSNAPIIQEESEHGIHADDVRDVGDEYEELPFDGEDYIDLGTTETDAFGDEIENGKPELRESGPPGKRSREPEDEVDLAETPSPDAKRRRSS